MTAHLVAALAQRLRQFGIVEQLTVENGDDGSGLVEDRLLPVVKANDAQAPARKSHSSSDEGPLFVRSSMEQALRHACKHAR